MCFGTRHSPNLLRRELTFSHWRGSRDPVESSVFFACLVRYPRPRFSSLRPGCERWCERGLEPHRVSPAGSRLSRFAGVSRRRNPERRRRSQCGRGEVEGPLVLLAVPAMQTLVRKGGLEPPRFYPPDPKSGASANSATFAQCRLNSSLADFKHVAAGFNWMKSEPRGIDHRNGRRVGAQSEDRAPANKETHQVLRRPNRRQETACPGGVASTACFGNAGRASSRR
jgi:hypothetical protein